MPPFVCLYGIKMNLSKNGIFYGDNLIWMKKIPDDFVDLIYLDPPFNSKKPYNIIYDSSKSKAQVRAFEDTWRWSTETQKTYDQLLTEDTTSQLLKTIKSFHNIFGNNNIMAYLVMMTPRLIEMRRILKKTGSIYLHCDPTSSHYLKIIMDALFRIENFQNEIIWHYGLGGSSPRRYQKKHDVIFFYSKSDDYTFKPIMVPATSNKMKGQLKKLDDVWDIPTINNMAKERTGYPTQKPEDLLERIIKASCPPDGIFLDPFCGCGTALIVAEKLKRKWIGIDITYLAIDVLRNRLEKLLNNIEDINFVEEGAPEGMAGVEHMAKHDKKGFEKFIIRKIGGVPNEKLDEGIDGYLFFKDGNNDKIAIIQETVNKAVSPNKVRDFRGTMNREEAAMGIFITMYEPTRGMTKEANGMGVYKDSFGNEYPKMQFITVRSIIDEGKKPDIPQIKPHGDKSK